MCRHGIFLLLRRRRVRTVVLRELDVLMDQSAKPPRPKSGAALPEAANGLSRVQHGYRSARRAKSTMHQLKWYFNQSRLTKRCPGRSSSKIDCGNWQLISPRFGPTNCGEPLRPNAN
jgi:hypothetical protein